MKFTHEMIEKNIGWMIVLIVLVVASADSSRSCRCISRSRRRNRSRASSPTRRCSSPGRDVYLREGCYNCHSQMIRPFRAETERYGHYSVAGEFVYDHPFQWGSKRTGPDLARVGGTLFGRLASRAPQQSARCRARVEHARLSVARARRALAAEDIQPKMRALRASAFPIRTTTSPRRRTSSRARPRRTR